MLKIGISSSHHLSLPLYLSSISTCFITTYLLFLIVCFACFACFACYLSSFKPHLFIPAGLSVSMVDLTGHNCILSTTACPATTVLSHCLSCLLSQDLRFLHGLLALFHRPDFSVRMQLEFCRSSILLQASAAQVYPELPVL